uniref:FHA domain-containing protein n=1 Tax=Steinernema glaseri TaxID=37863 RepID=A0A1I7ZHH3_9BILA
MWSPILPIPSTYGDLLPPKPLSLPVASLPPRIRGLARHRPQGALPVRDRPRLRGHPKQLVHRVRSTPASAHRLTRSLSRWYMSLFARDYAFVDSLIASNDLEQLRDDIAARENLLSKAEIAIGLEAASAGRVGLSQDDDAPCRSIAEAESAAFDGFWEAPLAAAEQSVWQGQWPLEAESLFDDALTHSVASVCGDVESRVRGGTESPCSRYRVNLTSGTPPGGSKCCLKRGYNPPPNSKRSSSSSVWNGALPMCCFMRGCDMPSGMQSRVHCAHQQHHHQCTTIAGGQQCFIFDGTRIDPISQSRFVRRSAPTSTGPHCWETCARSELRQCLLGAQ